MQNYSPIYPYPNAYAMPQNPYQHIPQPIVQPQNDGPIMAWVQGGINGAKSYPVPPNQRAYLFDSEEDTFYVKDVDQNGMPKPLRAFDYTSMRRGRSSRTNGGNMSGRRSSRANNSMRNYSGHDQKEMMLQKIAEMQRQIEDME